MIFARFNIILFIISVCVLLGTHVYITLVSGLPNLIGFVPFELRGFKRRLLSIDITPSSR